MTAPTKFNSFTTDLTNGVHNFSTHTFKVMLTNTAPVATNTVFANITDITAGNGYTAAGLTTTVSKSNTSGVEKLIFTSPTWTATGAFATFRYVVVYNDTQTSPAKPLVFWVDYGSPVSMVATNTFTPTFDGSNGAITVG
jgi:hypothetical protein